MPIKLRITLTITIDSSASIIGIAKSSAWCFGLAPEVNNHNMNVMLQHLRDLGYKIPDSYDNKFQNFLQDYSRDLRQAYDGLGHQNNPFDTMFSGFIDVVEDQSGLDMDNLLFNSIDLISRD